MEVVIAKQKRVNGIDVSIAVTVKTGPRELTVVEVQELILGLLEEKDGSVKQEQG